MARHVERGEGRAALLLLPALEAGPEAVADEARRVALLAARQADVPIGEELRLMRARLRRLAPDLTRPAWVEPSWGGYEYKDAASEDPWRRIPASPEGPTYREALEDALSRLESRDRSHRASVDLLLSELDRLPEAEALWEELAGRLEGWNLDDELGPRYERALARFSGPGLWPRAARWYARRRRAADLERLAGDLAGRFRAGEVFERLAGLDDLRLAVAGQPPVGARVRLVPWADWVRLRALERFPHSPRVVAEAAGRLERRSAWQKRLAERGPARLRAEQPVVVEDALLDERRGAVLFADPERRREAFALDMRRGRLAARLEALEARAERTPVEDLLLFEGWAHLSRFEQAAPAADRLAAAYPGDASLAGRTLSLHRSLAPLDPGHAAAAEAVVARTAPALADPSALLTELGELHEERGRSAEAVALWRRLVEREPRSPERVEEVATLLWDYGHAAEALREVERGRERLARPRLLAFEAGVLREQARDAVGAVREYLDAGVPEGEECFCSWFERDQRALRRLAELLSRPRVFDLVRTRLAALRPAVRADEQELTALLPLATVETPDPGLDWDADDWIDGMDLPRDPVGREERDRRRAARRGREHEAIARMGEALLARAEAHVPAATSPEFLDAIEAWARPLIEARWEAPRAAAFLAAILARQAELAPTAEARVDLEVRRARDLLEKGLAVEADAAWAALRARLDGLPEGAARLRAEAARAVHVERRRGVEAAAAHWRALTARYPWSLGLLEDRLAFLARSGRGEEGREVLEAVVATAGPGHREVLLERLTRDALAAGDTVRARRAVEALLPSATLEDDRRLAVLHLLGRLSFKEDAAFDAMPLAAAETRRLPPERQADVYQHLARAADVEGVGPAATALWIEALNRRPERAWLVAAARSAARAGRAEALLTFFERQRERSPRDVRWGTAVSVLRRQAGDMEGALEAARAAVAVRPERLDLWQDVVDLLERLGRQAEASDFLEGWSRPRPADESVATWRGRLYADAGDGDRALAVERGTLEAFAREAGSASESAHELAERRGRAALRLVGYGHALRAWSLLSPDGSVAAVAESRLTDREQSELALATDRFLALLRQRSASDEYREWAARTLGRLGRPEQKDEVLAWLLSRIHPAGGPSEAGLRRWWPFAATAGVQAPLAEALARRHLALRPGPWGADPPVAFARDTGAALVQRDAEGRLVFHDPPREALWVRALVRDDRPEALADFLAPRWDALLAEVRGPVALSRDPDRVAWAGWLDEPAALETWARGLAGRPAALAGLAEAFHERRRWDRLWARAARAWNVAPLVALLPEATRGRWFAFFKTQAPELALRARVESEVATAVGRLVSGVAGAERDALVAKLRGPRTVGDLLGRDPDWTWPEFEPRRDATGRVIETGEYRAFGQGVDRGRIPGALWSDRPGTAWFVLETLARLREGGPEAALVPLEVPERGNETLRATLGARVAEALGRPELALEVVETHAPASGDADALRLRLRLLLAVGRRDEAATRLGERVRVSQEVADESAWRAWSALAEDLGLPPPMAALDPSRPLSPALLAYLVDADGPAVAERLRPADLAGYRSALDNRWRSRAGDLSPDQVRYQLGELWLNQVGGLPREGLRTLGGLWAPAGSWLEGSAPGDRAGRLAALEALPDTAALRQRLEMESASARNAGSSVPDAARLLMARILLGAGEDEGALALLDGVLAEAAAAPPLSYPQDDATEAAEDDVTEERPGPDDAMTARLRAWLRPFQDAARPQAAAERIRRWLAERRPEGATALPALRLELELTPVRDRRSLARELDRAWLRGEVPSTQALDVAEMLARLAPGEAAAWLPRVPASREAAHVLRLAEVHRRLGDPAAAARRVLDGRSRGPWTPAQEVRAFDFWRRLPADAASPPAPASWLASATFWSRPAAESLAGLGEHLRSHPFDLRAARVAVRTLLEGDVETLRRARAALAGSPREPGEPDSLVLDLRAARGQLPTSWRAARATLGALDPSQVAPELVRRRFPRAEVDGALADLARVYARASEPGPRDALLALLQDRRAAGLPALRAELRLPGPSEAPFRLVEGRAAPYRPRDLTWAVLRTALEAKP
jgi:hypothetical protein